MPLAVVDLTELRQKAEQCRRLARGVFDHRSLAVLSALATELEARIRKLEDGTPRKTA